MYEEIETSRLVRDTLDELGVSYRAIGGSRVAAFDGRRRLRLLLRASAGLFCWPGHADRSDRRALQCPPPRFKADEAALPIGVALHVTFALASQAELASG